MAGSEKTENRLHSDSEVRRQKTEDRGRKAGAALVIAVPDQVRHKLRPRFRSQKTEDRRQRIALVIAAPAAIQEKVRKETPDPFSWYRIASGKTAAVTYSDLLWKVQSHTSVAHLC